MTSKTLTLNEIEQIQLRETADMKKRGEKRARFSVSHIAFYQTSAYKNIGANMNFVFLLNL